MANRELIIAVDVSPTQVAVQVEDKRAETIHAFELLSAGQRDQLALDAWRVGARAIMVAYRQAEEARLSDIGKALIEDVDAHLTAHADAQEKALTKALGRYFDPSDGEFSTRMSLFLGDKGVLLSLLEKYLAPQNSVLAETLTKHLGEQSPLFRRLSPTDSEGLVHLLGDRCQKVLKEEHAEFQKALDPLQNGAVGQFIAKLRDELKRAENDQAEQLKVALAALDTTKEDSLLNQMRRETNQARADLLRAINPASEGSPLSIIKNSLTELLAEHARSQREQLEETKRQNAEFQQDVRESMFRIEARRREEAQTVRGGVLFEDAVAEFFQNVLGPSGYLVDPTGNVTGLRPNCKVGDLVVAFPPDHAFRDARIVVEAKRDRSYTAGKALEELTTARENRKACAGIFVMARSHALAGFPTFSRYGQDILVVWDDLDPKSDPYLQAALMVGLALATRSKANGEASDLQALGGIEQRLIKELERLGKIKKSADAIRKQAESIEKEVGGGEEKVARILQDAKKTLLALNVELREEEVERRSPIAVSLPVVPLDHMLAAGGAE